jgi:hypothetical protein
MTIWCMRVACWVPKATNTHTGSVIIIVLPLQQWLHIRASMLRYTYIVSVAVYDLISFTVLPQSLVRVLKEVSPTLDNVKQHNKTLRMLNTLCNCPPHCPTHGYSTSCAPQ